MKRSLLSALVVLLTAFAGMQGSGRDAGSKQETASALRGWGAATDPDGDCRFYLADGSLLIQVPGSEQPHDLAAEVGTTNAPRVLQPVSGDFTIQVCVDGRFAPGDDSTLPGRTAYNGAGLAAMADERNVVTLARAVIKVPDEEAQPYANFEIRSAGELQRIGSTGDHALPPRGPVYLRLERRGSVMHGAVSLDGRKWDALEPKYLDDSWPPDLKIGLVAISTSTEEFNPRFSNLQMIK